MVQIRGGLYIQILYKMVVILMLELNEVHGEIVFILYMKPTNVLRIRYNSCDNDVKYGF